jgi:hypothetical protein
MTHHSNQPILSIVLSGTAALVSLGNFVPLVQILAGLIAIVSGCIAIYKQLKKK